MQFAGGVGAVQLKLTELEVVAVTVSAVGAGVSALQVPPPEWCRCPVPKLPMSRPRQPLPPCRSRWLRPSDRNPRRTRLPVRSNLIAG